MRVLYFINAGIMGGRERHVHTLVKSLPPYVEYCVCAVSAGEATEAMAADGVNVVVLGGKNGHDFKIYRRFKRLLKTFKPDVVHAHATALLPFIALRSLKSVPVVLSIHGPSTSIGENNAQQKRLLARIKSWLLDVLQRHPDYYLPVSKATWRDFLTVMPMAQGEVLYNALNLSSLPSSKGRRTGNIVGMVGRMADVKDWPAFLQIIKEVLIRKPEVEVWAVGDGPVRADIESLWQCLSSECRIDKERLKWFGSRQDARELIGMMDVFILSSKHEQLPTTLLEAFMLRTPVVGFMPLGGTEEILAFANGSIALLNRERDVVRAAEDVVRVLEDKSLRAEMIAEGYRVATEYFDMKKICATQLMSVYSRVIEEKK